MCCFLEFRPIDVDDEGDVDASAAAVDSASAVASSPSPAGSASATGASSAILLSAACIVLVLFFDLASSLFSFSSPQASPPTQGILSTQCMRSSMSTGRSLLRALIVKALDVKRSTYTKVPDILIDERVSR